MSDDRCKSCDRVGCPTLGPLEHEEGHRADCPACVASADCEAHRVDWRGRALAAEATILANQLPDLTAGPRGGACSWCGRRYCWGGRAKCNRHRWRLDEAYNDGRWNRFLEAWEAIGEVAAVDLDDRAKGLLP